MESAFDAFVRHEERLQELSLRPTEYVAAPGPGHAVPHRGRRLDHRAGRARGLPVLVGLPARRGRSPSDRALRGSLGDASEHVRQRFYCDNFIDLMGTALTSLVSA